MSKNFTLLLLLFYALGGKIEGRKRIQKIVCIAKHKYGIEFPFEFYPYFYGPYSMQLQDVLDILVSAKILEEKVEATPSGYNKYTYSLTKEGENLAKIIQDRLDDKKILEKLNELKRLKEYDIEELVKEAKQILHEKAKKHTLESWSM
ncbi:MAG: hypothetical protein QW193_05825 [Nitrososphaerales archaeon]